MLHNDEGKWETRRYVRNTGMKRDKRCRDLNTFLKLNFDQCPQNKTKSRENL